MLPVFTAVGHGVMAPDLPGFGKSDKPADDARCTFMFQRDLLKNLAEACDAPYPDATFKGGVRRFPNATQIALHLAP